MVALSEAVYSELERRGGHGGRMAQWGRWMFGPDPIEKLVVTDAVGPEGEPVLFLSYIQSSGHGAWDLFLDAAKSAARAEGVEDAILMLEATRETESFWVRNGLGRFQNDHEALRHYPYLSLDMLTPMYGRLSDLPTRAAPNPRGGPVVEPPRDLEEYLPTSRHLEWLGRAYFQDGEKIASSREVRAEYPVLDPGTWRIDAYPLAYGREIYELVEVSPRELVPTEFDWKDPRDALRIGGKWPDVQRYARWMQEGWTPPPISVVESEMGDLRVTDGHRRLAAADIAGNLILAWVSWTVDQPEGLRDAVTGMPIVVGLTYELAHPGVVRSPNKTPPVMRGSSCPDDFDPVGWYVSEKLDGVRAYWDGKRLVSRAGNVFAAPKWFTKGFPRTHLDGELYGGRGKFNETSGWVRRKEPHEGWRKLIFVVFDLPLHPGIWKERQDALALVVESVGSPYLTVASQTKVRSSAQMQSMLKKVEEGGGEGLMLVDPAGDYTQGRTKRLLKVKTFHDDEGVVIRSVEGSGKNRGRLGALWVRDAKGTQFKVGTGFTTYERENATELFPPGTVITYAFFERGKSGKPRFPSFVRIRSEEPV